MMTALVIAFVLTSFALIALVWSLFRILRSIYEESRVPTYRSTHSESTRSESTHFWGDGSYPDGADEPDGSSYAVVHGDVRLE
jgi:hypothetical protein